MECAIVDSRGSERRSILGIDTASQAFTECKHGPPRLSSRKQEVLALISVVSSAAWHLESLNIVQRGDGVLQLRSRSERRKFVISP